MTKNPNAMGPPDEPWLLLTDDGPEFFETEDDAREAAEDAMEDYVLAGNTSAARRVLYAEVKAYVVKKGESSDEREEELECDEEDEFIPDTADVYDYELLDVVAETPYVGRKSH